jgi:hypothetical protein
MVPACLYYKLSTVQKTQLKRLLDSSYNPSRGEGVIGAKTVYLTFQKKSE